MPVDMPFDIRTIEHAVGIICLLCENSIWIPMRKGTIFDIGAIGSLDPLDPIGIPLGIGSLLHPLLALTAAIFEFNLLLMLVIIAGVGLRASGHDRRDSNDAKEHAEPG